MRCAALCNLQSAICNLPSALCPLPSAICPPPSALCPAPCHADLVVIQWTPCWAKQEALAEDAEAVVSPHPPLDIEDRRAARETEAANAPAREGADYVHDELVGVSHATMWVGGQHVV